MRLKPTLDAAIAQLTAAGTGSPRLNAEVLLMFTLGCDRAYLYAHTERELSTEEQARYQAALEERARGKPAQYITGHQEFWGLDLLVSPAVLIPRPETEHVIETVLELADALPVCHPELISPEARRAEALSEAEGVEGPAQRSPLATHHSPPREESAVRSPLGPRHSPLRLVDVGTGSGCIALALAKELPGAEIIAVDISAAALEIARANAARLQLDQRVTFFESDLLAGLESNLLSAFPPSPTDCHPEQFLPEVRRTEALSEAEGESRSAGRAQSKDPYPADKSAADPRHSHDAAHGFPQFDFIVSNPPYVGSSAPEKVQREVREFEPRVAVFAGESGLEVYRQLIPQARQRLAPGGWLVMEIGFSMEAAVRALLEGWQEVRVTHDLQGIPRVVAAKK